MLYAWFGGGCMCVDAGASGVVRWGGKVGRGCGIIRLVGGQMPLLGATRGGAQGVCQGAQGGGEGSTGCVPNSGKVDGRWRAGCDDASRFSNFRTAGNKRGRVCRHQRKQSILKLQETKEEVARLRGKLSEAEAREGELEAAMLHIRREVSDRDRWAADMQHEPLPHYGSVHCVLKKSRTGSTACHRSCTLLSTSKCHRTQNSMQVVLHHFLPGYTTLS